MYIGRCIRSQRLSAAHSHLPRFAKRRMDAYSIFDLMVERGLMAPANEVNEQEDLSVRDWCLSLSAGLYNTYASSR
jgi:hypothetical protein